MRFSDVEYEDCSGKLLGKPVQGCKPSAWCGCSCSYRGRNAYQHNFGWFLTTNTLEYTPPQKSSNY